jgi:hypothetical protein
MRGDSISLLAAVSAAVPVRLMKRDLLFIGTQLAELVGEGHLETIAKQHGIKRSKATENIGRLFSAYLRRADEGTLSRVVVELTMVLAASRECVGHPQGSSRHLQGGHRGHRPESQKRSLQRRPRPSA